MREFRDWLLKEQATLEDLQGRDRFFDGYYGAITNALEAFEGPTPVADLPELPEFREVELMGRPVLSLPLPDIYEIARYLERDFGLSRNLKDPTTEALRELQRELKRIIEKREKTK